MMVFSHREFYRTSVFRGEVRGKIRKNFPPKASLYEHKNLSEIHKLIEFQRD